MSYDQLTGLIKRSHLKNGDNSDLRFDLEQYGEVQEFNLIGKEPDEVRYKNVIKKVTKKLFSQNPEENDLLAIVCFAPTLKKEAWQKLKPQINQKDILKNGALKQIITSKAPMQIRNEAAEILVEAEKSLLQIWDEAHKNLKDLLQHSQRRKKYFECLKTVKQIKEDLKLVLVSKLPQELKKAAARSLLDSEHVYESNILLLIKKHVPSLRNNADIILREKREA